MEELGKLIAFEGEMLRILKILGQQYKCDDLIASKILNLEARTKLAALCDIVSKEGDRRFEELEKELES